MPLSDPAIRAAKGGEKPCKLFDAKGLFLLVTPQGSKLWRVKYRFARKDQLLSLGAYPEVTLKQARVGRDEVRRQVAAGIDPSAARKALKATQAGEAVLKYWRESGFTSSPLAGFQPIPAGYCGGWK